MLYNVKCINTSSLTIELINHTEIGPPASVKSGFHLQQTQANKEAHLELFRVFLALRLVEFQCFGGHFENEYQVCFEV